MFHEDDDGDDDDDDDYYCSSAGDLGWRTKIKSVVSQSQFTVGEILNETRTYKEVGALRRVKTFTLSCEY